MCLLLKILTDEKYMKSKKFRVQYMAWSPQETVKLGELLYNSNKMFSSHYNSHIFFIPIKNPKSKQENEIDSFSEAEHQHH